MRTSGKSRDKAPKERRRPGRKGRGQTLAKDDDDDEAEEMEGDERGVEQV